VKFRVLKSAARRIEEIYEYTLDTWGKRQADKYLDGLFRRFGEIAERKVVWKLIPAKYGVKGYYCRFEQHYIFWRELTDGHVGIAAILHAKMHHLEHLSADFGD
jgi:toxin ParE1/3/4